MRLAPFSIEWPHGKTFAFTIFDDTDLSTFANVAPVYELLEECRIITTKSVWPIKGNSNPRVGGDTCENKDYLNWIYRLKHSGFEIALHNVTFHTSTRLQIQRGFERFKELFGDYPTSFANHTGCNEGIYWGDARLTGGRRFVYNILTRFKRRNQFRGHLEGDELFWGDLSREKLTFVRNFVFRDINTLKRCPFMPYHDPAKPFVNYWFASSEGAKVEAFNRCLRESNQDRLEEEGGACIMYTHLAGGFYQRGQLNSDFERLIKRLSQKNGWFVPVSTLMDYILEKRGPYTINDTERKWLEWRWLCDKLIIGSS